MKFRSIAIHALGATVVAALLGANAGAQQAQGSAQASSATHVAAEMTKGKLNPNESKPGDKVSLRLKEDVKSNGQVILKKGTAIEGVVKSVKKTESKTEANGQAQSMMQIEWLAPAAQGKATQQLSIALQSVSYISPLQRHRETESGDDWPARSSASGSVASTASAAGSAGGGLLGGVGGTVGGVVGSTTSVATDVAGATGSVASNTTARAAGTSNVALMSMPNVVAADSHTTSTLESTFGLSSSSQLYKVGRGEVVSAGGTKHSMDIYSHMANDTVITSPSKNFEVSSGAQMQLLVGVKR